MCRPLILIAASTFVSACAGSERSKIPDPPAPETRAFLSGPLCQGEACRCRQSDDEAGLPPAEHKRFELHLGPTAGELWVTVGDMVLFKRQGLSEDCYYIDLRPGEHRVAVRARGEPGFGAQVAISELGTSGPWWYDTFEFSCGAPDLCDQETLEAWKKRTRELGSRHDPCGSVKVKGINWETGTMPDLVHPSDFLLELVLDVYRFQPENPPGGENC